MLDKVLYQHVSGSLFSHKTHLEGTLKLHNPNLFTHIFMPKPFMYLYQFQRILQYGTYLSSYSPILSCSGTQVPLEHPSFPSLVLSTFLTASSTLHSYTLHSQFPLARTLSLPSVSCCFSFRGQVSFCQGNDQTSL